MWALDGRRVYYTGLPNFGLRSLEIGATASEPFDNPGGFMHFEDLTRDGRFVILKNSNTGSGIAIQRLGVPSERSVLFADATRRLVSTQPRVSPDGQWLAYTQSTQGAPAQVFVQPFGRAGERLQVSAVGGSGAVWRGDGRELFYESAAGLMAMSVTERAGTLELGPSKRLFSLRTPGLITNQPHHVEVAANGQKFLVNAIVGDSDNAPLEVTLNWTAALKK